MIASSALLFLLAASISVEAAKPPTISIKNVTDLGDILILNITQYVGRDLGWLGQVGSTYITTYGDTLHCTSTSYPTGRDCSNNLGPLSANSMAVNTFNPLVVNNPSYVLDGNQQQVPTQFVQYFSDEDPTTHGMGINAVQDVNGTHGAIWFTYINRDTQTGAHPIGTGIAIVDNSRAGFPKATRLHRYFWNASEPQFGGASFTAPDKSFIYVLGQAFTNTSGANTYITRVPKAQAWNTSAYQYWQGSVRGWTYDRIFNPNNTQAITGYKSDGTIGPLADHTGNGGVGQASVFWSPYYSAYVHADTESLSFFVPSQNGWFLRTALSPEGPWSQPVLAFQWNQTVPSTANDPGTKTVRIPGYPVNNATYAFCTHPEWDTSGRTLLSTYTYGAAVQRMVNITFN